MRIPRLPLITFFSVIVLCFAIGENFPFSNFPMYRSFSDYSYYIYFTDGDDKPIPIKDLTGHRTSALKKTYDKVIKTTRKEIEANGTRIEGFRFMTAGQRKPAGDYTLEWLFGNPTEGHENWQASVKQPVRLRHVDIRVEGKKTVKDDNLISEK